MSVKLTTYFILNYDLLQTQETLALVTTILDVQPRLSGGSGGKSNDEIVYELSESILEKVTDKLDMENAKQEMFELDDKGRNHSLTTVLVQEVDRFNKLLKVVKVRLGHIIFTPRCRGIVFTHGVRMGGRGRRAAGKSLSGLYLRNRKV